MIAWLAKLFARPSVRPSEQTLWYCTSIAVNLMQDEWQYGELLTWISSASPAELARILEHDLAPERRVGGLPLMVRDDAAMKISVQAT